jgi:molecular chaperone GrpE
MTDEQTHVPVGDAVPSPAEDELAQTELVDEACAVEADPGTGEATPPDLDELRTRAAERDEYLALAQRTRADLENYRKRATREAANAESRATVRVVRELLPAIDNLGRALAAATTHGLGPTDQSTTLAEGMRLVHGELLGAFARVGVEAYEPVGERFDPASHEAIAQHHVPGAEPGTVVEVYQSGYRLDGSVIRPARVVVAGEPPAGDAPGS